MEDRIYGEGSRIYTIATVLSNTALKGSCYFTFYVCHAGLSKCSCPEPLNSGASWEIEVTFDRNSEASRLGSLTTHLVFLGLFACFYLTCLPFLVSLCICFVLFWTSLFLCFTTMTMMMMTMMTTTTTTTIAATTVVAVVFRYCLASSTFLLVIVYLLCLTITQVSVGVELFSQQ